MALSESDIRNRLETVQENIIKACKTSDRDPSSVKLVIVTKGHTRDIVAKVIAAGGKLIGENYVEEALTKKKTIGPASVEWHMVGHIQSRKARSAIDCFDFIHSVDRLKIARKLNHFAELSNKEIPVLIECNVSGEESKNGYLLHRESEWVSFINEIAQILEFRNIKVKGLMTIPPYREDVEEIRKYFRKLRELKDFLEDELPQNNWGELSMGMSHDYVVAVQEGATIVRVGTAIVGPRS